MYRFPMSSSFKERASIEGYKAKNPDRTAMMNAISEVIKQDIRNREVGAIFQALFQNGLDWYGPLPLFITFSYHMVASVG